MKQGRVTWRWFMWYRVKDPVGVEVTIFIRFGSSWCSSQNSRRLASSHTTASLHISAQNTLHNTRLPLPSSHIYTALHVF